MRTFSDLTFRFLRDDERDISTNLLETPLVIEPGIRSDIQFLIDFLRKDSRNILKDISTHGAVLLRNFQIRSETEFEQVVASIEGIKPMSSYFMSEAGRTRVEGTEFVFYTNRIFKTGGTFKLGSFHTENYYTPDVPRYICFYCSEASSFGGETGLTDMANVYDNLSSGLKTRLEAQPFLTSGFLIEEVARRYKIPVDQVKEVCKEFGLTLASPPDVLDETILHYKSSIFDHPDTKRPALLVNLSGSIQGLDIELRREFRKDYPGFRWFVHRLVWDSPFLIKLNNLAFLKFQYALKMFWKYLRSIALRIGRKKKEQLKTNEKPFPFPTESLGTSFGKEDVQALAKLMRHNFVSFKWKAGDVLLIDSLRMAHSGMPGFGKRILRAIISNPVPMKFSKCSGRQAIANGGPVSSLAEILEAKFQKS